MNKYTIGNNEMTITLPLDALTAQLKMQGLTLLLDHELPAFNLAASPQPDAGGEKIKALFIDVLFKRAAHFDDIWYLFEAKELNDAITSINKLVPPSEFDNFSTLLPTREQGERKFSQSEIEALQSSIYKITGKGEVMALFNKMLGVNAG